MKPLEKDKKMRESTRCLLAIKKIEIHKTINKIVLLTSFLIKLRSLTLMMMVLELIFHNVFRG